MNVKDAFVSRLYDRLGYLEDAENKYLLSCNYNEYKAAAATFFDEANTHTLQLVYEWLALNTLRTRENVLLEAIAVGISKVVFNKEDKDE